MSDLILKVDGVRYEGWKRLQVSRGIEQLAGAFDITCADRWAIQRLPLPILKGKACTVEMGGKTIITGFIDAAAPFYSSRSHDLAIRGRDATGDLVDSSATTKGSGWKGRSLRQIAETLCQPHGIKVLVEPSAAKEANRPFQYQHLQLGETVAEALARLAKIRGVLLMSNGLGQLLMTRAGSTRANTRLVLGQNVLEARGEDSDLDRYHEYRVIAQARESDEFEGQRAQQIGAPVFDTGVRRGRLLIIDPHDATDRSGCQQLAAWNRSTRAAKGAQVTYTVRGWMDGDRPWQPNTLVQVQDPWARFDGDYLIASVDQGMDERGELTTLTTVPPAAYELLPQREINPEADDE